MSDQFKLNVRQKAFADHYIILGNAKEAAIEAGYSKKYAGQNADKLLKNTNVSKYIENRMAELEDDMIAKQEEVLKYLTRVMRREEPEHTAVVIKKSASKWVDGPDGKPKKVTESWEEPQLVAFPTKVSDANKAAELLGKRYALFTDNQNNSGETRTVIVTGEDEMRRILDERQNG